MKFKFKFIKSKDFDFIRSLIKNWDEFREDSNLLLLNYPQIGSVKSMSGGINVKGNVEGNASSMSGSVIVNKIKF